MMMSTFRFLFVAATCISSTVAIDVEKLQLSSTARRSGRRVTANAGNTRGAASGTNSIRDVTLTKPRQLKKGKGKAKSSGKVSGVPSASPSASPSAPPTLPTIADIACSIPDFSTLCQLVIDTGLDAVLADPMAGPFTVFAPTNEAFAAIADLIASLPPDSAIDIIREVILYHAVAGVVLQENLVCEAEVTTLAETLVVSSTSTTQCIVASDGTAFFQVGDGQSVDLLPRIVAFDILASNGVVHVVDNVIIPEFI